MPGRKPKVRWTPSLKQFTVTVGGKLHRLGTDKDAAAVQFQFLLHKHDLSEPATTNPTFADVADAWLEHVLQNHDPERYRLCKARLTEFVAFAGVNLKLRDLRPRHVEAWLKARPGATTPGTATLYKGMILAALNWAASKRVRLIAANPLRGLLELPEGRSRGGEAVWSPEVFQLVLANVNGRFAEYLRALAWTGARPSAVRRVEARHYRPDLKLWDIGDLVRDHSKKKAHRIWLAPPMVEMVERLNAEHPTGPIFRNTQGNPYSGDVVTMTLFKLRRRLLRRTPPVELPKGLCVYGLRHTFATAFIREHPDKLEYLRELLGHRDMKMIRKHYGHLYDQHHAMHSVLDSFSPV